MDTDRLKGLLARVKRCGDRVNDALAELEESRNELDELTAEMQGILAAQGQAIANPVAAPMAGLAAA